MAFGVTGQTYSQVPQPLQRCWLIRIPIPGIGLIASSSHRSMQAKQPLFLARQVSLQATADRSSLGAGTNSVVSGTVRVGSCGLFRALLKEQTASPSVKRLFLKKSLRLMFMASYFSPFSALTSLISPGTWHWGQVKRSGCGVSGAPFRPV